MKSFTVFKSQRHGATLAGIFCVGLCSIMLLCGAGLTPTGNVQTSDINANGYSLTNAGTVSAANVAATNSLTVPGNFFTTNNVALTSGSYANPAWITSLAGSKLTGSVAATSVPWSGVTSTPTSLSGYGIADPIVVTSGSYANPAWLTSLAYAKLTGAPTFSTGLTNTGGTITANVVSVAGRTGAVTLGASDVSGLAASATTDTTSAGNISSGTLGTARLGSGTASSSTFLRGDQTWQPVGTVTSVTAGAGLTGGTITGSGTVALDTAAANTFTGAQTFTANGYYYRLASDVSQTGLTLTNTSMAVTLPVGTYRYKIQLYMTTVSSSGGMYADIIAASGDSLTAFYFTTGSINGSPVMRASIGSGTSFHLSSVIGDAPSSAAFCDGSGLLTVSTNNTNYTVQFSQRNSVDSSNPAILKAGSWMYFERIR